MLALMASVDSQATQQDYGYRLVGGQTPHEPHGLDRMERPGGSGCSVMMAGGLRICVGCRV